MYVFDNDEYEHITFYASFHFVCYGNGNHPHVSHAQHYEYTLYKSLHTVVVEELARDGFGPLSSWASCV